MSFRQNKNRHDEWVTYRDVHREALNGTGLPEATFATEDHLIRFLSDGKAEGVDLRTMPDEEFERLESVINDFFHDGWEQRSWTALSTERLRRFGRHA
jgi:hypothetical protein